MDNHQMELLLAKAKEKLGDEEFTKLLKEVGPDRDVQAAVDFFHLTFCSEQHEPDGCLYYNEQELSSTWSRPHHRKWLDKAENLMAASSLSTQEFSDTLRRVTNTLSDLMQCSEQQRLLFLDLLSHESVQKALRK